MAAATTAQTAATARDGRDRRRRAATARRDAAEPPRRPTEPPADAPAPIALTGLPAEATADTTVPAGLDLSKRAATADARHAGAQDAAVPADATAAADRRRRLRSGAAEHAGPAHGHAAPRPAAAAADRAQGRRPGRDRSGRRSGSDPARSPHRPLPPQITTPSVERAVPLSRAVATSGLLIHIAAERGVTHARLNLKPVELGGIEVRLQTSPQGVHAQLVADSPEAARMLSSASEDLRRSLEDRDVTLLSLDVSTSGDQSRDQPAQFTDAFGEDYRPGGWTDHRVVHR